MRSRLLSRLERRLNETSKSLRRIIAAKFSMHLLGSLMKLNRINEVLMHEGFSET